MVDLGPLAPSCACATIRNMAGNVVARIGDDDCTQHGPSGVTFANLIADQQRLNQDAVRALATVPMVIGPREAVRPVGLHAYWRDGPGADQFRFRAAPGWCAPDPTPAPAPLDRRPPEPTTVGPPAHHWGEYDQWLTPTDRTFLDDQWARAGGVAQPVDLSWITTERIGGIRVDSGWWSVVGGLLGIALGLAIFLVAWGVFG